MWRWMLNLAAALSLVMCVMTVALWVRSYAAEDYVVWNLPHKRTYVGNRDGYIVIQCGSYWGAYSFEPDSDGLFFRTRHDAIKYAMFPSAASGDFLFNTFGVVVWYGSHGPHIGSLTEKEYEVFIPHLSALVAELIALLSALALAARARKRTTTGLCPTCGYDLRATTNRCPECGTEVAKGS